MRSLKGYNLRLSFRMHIQYNERERESVWGGMEPYTDLLINLWTVVAFEQAEIEYKFYNYCRYYYYFGYKLT